MVARGPDYLHAAATYEPVVIAYNLRFPNLTQPLEFIFPADVTFWMNNPLCVLVSELGLQVCTLTVITSRNSGLCSQDNVSWTTPLDIEAAKLFVNYSTQPAQVITRAKAYFLLPATLRRNFPCSSSACSAQACVHGAHSTTCHQMDRKLRAPTAHPQGYQTRKCR